MQGGLLAEVGGVVLVGVGGFCWGCRVRLLLLPALVIPLGGGGTTAEAQYRWIKWFKLKILILTWTPKLK